MILKSAAKINLVLDIVGKNEIGYHKLFTVMQSISLYDELELEINSSGEIRFFCDKECLSLAKENIAYKSAILFFEKTGIENPGIDIKLFKKIPMQAGLAGGSSDGAAVLRGLNELLECNLSDRHLCLIGEELGADVPFCLMGGTMLAQNIGELLSSLKDLKDVYFVLVKPESNVSTLKAYESFDNHDGPIYHVDTDEVMSAFTSGGINDISSVIRNVFEQVIEIPDRTKIKSIMREFGSMAECMSGSGATIYAMFDNKKSAIECEARLREEYNEVFLCEPISKGIEIVEK